ncbi:hypothetical protein GII36_05340 [Candidatus Mycosynbacter amalyticus]|uniref:Uncharacterized protein n=1 Tax=Candidatus Mycosynbacter amalyticus TaxID=2665156 RepID=A0A857MQA0_9BACT|nr:hypothetical protein [Candidatus Mycosynbacter amalyticus]QHN43241.1 hypothetical protein GII36_05340 [Candidatus Mycosynbacter amalyticus]
MKRKVYFACSIRGGGDTSLYQQIVDAIKAAGGDVLSEVFVHDAINYGGSLYRLTKYMHVTRR